MKNSFEYLYLTQSNDSIEIEDIGNCAILANNDMGQTWVFIIKTLLGFSYIIEYGPYYNYKLTDYLNSSFQKIEYSEFKIKKKIDKFLNDPRRMITQVQLIDEDEALNKIDNVAEVFNESYQ